MSQPYNPPPSGRDPRAPFGAAQSSVSIDTYAPPRPKASLVIAIVVAAIALATALVVLTQPPDTPTPVASSAPPKATSTPSWGQPFVSRNSAISGEWQIASHEWTAYGLRVQVRIAVENGPLHPGFTMFTNDAAEVVYPLPTPDSPGFEEVLNSGDDRTAWLTFPISHSDATIVLEDIWAGGLSALEIKG